MTLPEKFKQTVRKYHLLQKNDLIVVAVSGGPDSVTLLYLLCGLKKELGLALHVAHLDHGLREDSHKDRIFVEELARRLNLPVTVAGAKLTDNARKGSVEEAARQVRLEFLFKLSRTIGASKIAIGHNRDDQAETVLMRILRGTGLYGLQAMLPQRNISGYQIIRPLIEVSRREIEAYLRKKKIKPRIDYTNFQDIYFRNKIRNKLMPLLEKEYNPNIREVLSSMAESAACDYDYLNRAAVRVMKTMSARISLGKLVKLHPALRRLILRLYINRCKGDTRRIDFQHIEEIEDLIFHRPLNSIVDLPKGVSVVKKKGSLIFYHRER